MYSKCTVSVHKTRHWYREVFGDVHLFLNLQLKFSLAISVRIIIPKAITLMNNKNMEL
jgi:hypothetical protein